MLEPIEIPFAFIERYLAKFIPEAREIMQMMKTDKPGDGLTPKLRQALTNLNIQNWAVLYQDPVNDLKARLLMFMTPQEINELNSKFLGLSAAEQSREITEMLQKVCDEADDEIDDIEEAFSPQPFEELPDEEKAERLKQTQITIYFLLPTLFNYFSMIVHKKSIYQLVAEAMAGNDESFLKAIQIDKTVLTDIPYFIERNRRAADDGEFNFQRQINTYRNKPIFLSRPQHSVLWLVFSCLDEMNVLEQFEKNKVEFLNLCQRLGVYGPAPEKDYADVFTFNKVLSRYKNQQDRKLPKPDQKILVKDITTPK